MFVACKEEKFKSQRQLPKFTWNFAVCPEMKRKEMKSNRISRDGRERVGKDTAGLREQERKNGNQEF